MTGDHAQLGLYYNTNLMARKNEFNGGRGVCRLRGRSLYIKYQEVTTCDRNLGITVVVYIYFNFRDIVR